MKYIDDPMDALRWPDTQDQSSNFVQVAREAYFLRQEIQDFASAHIIIMASEVLIEYWAADTVFHLLAYHLRLHKELCFTRAEPFLRQKIMEAIDLFRHKPCDAIVRDIRIHGFDIAQRRILLKQLEVAKYIEVVSITFRTFVDG